MTTTRPLILLVLAAALTGCESSPQVQSAYAPGVDFSQYQTYDWLPTSGVVGTVLPARSINQFIVEALQEELAAKGMKPAGGRIADVSIGYRGGVQDRSEVNQWGLVDTNWGGSQRRVMQATESTTYTQGTLIIDFIDSRQRRLIWRSALQSVVTPGASEEEARSHIRAAVHTMMQHYPPGT